MTAHPGNRFDASDWLHSSNEKHHGLIITSLNLCFCAEMVTIILFSCPFLNFISSEPSSEDQNTPNSGKYLNCRKASEEVVSNLGQGSHIRSPEYHDHQNRGPEHQDRFRGIGFSGEVGGRPNLQPYPRVPCSGLALSRIGVRQNDVISKCHWYLLFPNHRPARLVWPRSLLDSSTLMNRR